jgi:phage antirepressor YoqD-like protein
MSGKKMNSLLHDLGVQYKQSGQWLLYAKYHKKGYTHSKTIEITRSDGTPDITMETKWTQKGRLFIYDLLKTNGILPLIERGEVA